MIMIWLHNALLSSTVEDLSAVKSQEDTNLFGLRLSRLSVV